MRRWGRRRPSWRAAEEEESGEDAEEGVEERSAEGEEGEEAG